MAETNVNKADPLPQLKSLPPDSLPGIGSGTGIKKVGEVESGGRSYVTASTKFLSYESSSGSEVGVAVGLRGRIGTWIRLEFLRQGVVHLWENSPKRGRKFATRAHTHTHTHTPQVQELH